jgi:hypothetical protein
MTDYVAAQSPDQKVIYEQRCEDFRSLNSFLWQSPIIIMTLTGGLWFAVATFAISNSGRSMLLVFAGLANLLMIGALIRLRWVMQNVLRDIRAYDGKHAVGGNFIIVGIFSTLLLMTAIGSLAAACQPSAYFTRTTTGSTQTAS